jgi:transcriptional regulator with XRE-family HTH domain
MLSVGYDGFQTDDFYEAVIFNFGKLNDNLVKDEADYLKQSSSSQANKSYDELLESSSKQQVQLGIQQAQINYDIDKQLAESSSWQERERTEMERYMDLARIKIQDKLYGVIKLQEDIEYSNGKPVGLDQDFRNAEVLMHGKAASDLTKSMEKAEKVVEDVKKSGVTLDEFDQLLYALHAQERNRSIRIQRTNISESITDLRKKNKLSLSEIAEMSGIDIETYRELEAGTAKKGITSGELNSILSVYGITLNEFYTQYSRENAGSGMTDIDAQTILSTYGLNPLKPNVKDLKPALRDAVDGVYAIISDSRERMLDYGLEALDTVVAFESLYNNYVPLRGFEGEDSASEIIGGGRSLEVRGREKRALGRKSKADSPFLTAVAQNQSTIVRARKNEVAQKLYKLAESNPNNQIWKVIDPSVNKEYKKKATSKGIKDVAKTISDYILDNRNFAVRIDGEYKFVQFTDPRMAEALRGANVVKAEFIVKYLGGFNRLLSSFITTYDPEFVLRNFSRDIQVAVINAVAEQEIEGGLLKGKDITSKIVKSVPKSIKAIFNMSKKGTKPSNEFEQYYADFLEDGAKTEWFYSKSIDELRSDIDKLVNGKGKNAIQAAGNFVERINTSVENGVRLAAYMEARKAGLSRDKAAELAKNLTVNFNKSGEWGTVANSLYLFFNASVQGTSRLIRTLKPQFKKNDDGTRSLQVTTAQKIAISMFIAGSLMSLLNEALSDDDEDGKSFYSKIPDFEKERNIIIMTGKNYIKIPLPYGLNVFYVAGNAMADAGQGIKTVGEVATNILQAAVGSFSPINFPSSEDFSSWIMKFITPTVGQIPLSLALNEDYFGRTIYNKNFPTDSTPKPESELGRKGGTEMNSWIAKELNKLTGGSELRSGVIDINPDKIDFFLETLSGGAGKFALRSTSTIGNLITGNWDQIESNNVPGLRVFYGQPRKFVNLQSYFDKRIEVNQFMEEVKAGNITGPESSRIKEVYRINKAVDSALRNLRKAEKTAENLEDPDRRENRLNEIEKKRYAQIANFQKAYEKYKIDKL